MTQITDYQRRWAAMGMTPRTAAMALTGQYWAEPQILAAAGPVPRETPVMGGRGRLLVMGGLAAPELAEGVTLRGAGLAEATVPSGWEPWVAYGIRPVSQTGPGTRELSWLSGDLDTGTMWAMVAARMESGSTDRLVGWCIVTRPVTAADLHHLPDGYAEPYVLRCPDCTSAALARQDVMEATWYPMITAGVPAPAGELCPDCGVGEAGRLTLWERRR